MVLKMDSASEGFHNSLDLFSLPPVDAGVFARNWVPYRPVTQISKGAPVIFSIPGTGSDYKDLTQTVLQLAVCIKTMDGAPVIEQDNVAFDNLTLHSVFKDLEISVGGKLMTGSVSSNYPYQAYLDIVLKF